MLKLKIGSVYPDQAEIPKGHQQIFDLKIWQGDLDLQVEDPEYMAFCQITWLGLQDKNIPCCPTLHPEDLATKRTCASYGLAAQIVEQILTITRMIIIRFGSVLLITFLLHKTIHPIKTRTLNIVIRCAINCTCFISTLHCGWE